MAISHGLLVRMQRALKQGAMDQPMLAARLDRANFFLVDTEPVACWQSPDVRSRLSAPTYT